MKTIFTQKIRLQEISILRLSRLFALLFLFSSCTDGLKLYSQLEGLRVLGVVADTPEINSPGTVTLTPYISYPEGASSSNLEVSYEACIANLTPPGTIPNCENPLVQIQPKTSYNAPLSGFPANAANTGALPSFQISVSSAPPPTFDEALLHNGIEILVLLTVTDLSSRETTTSTLKRIFYTSRTSNLNTNPSFSGFENASGPLTSFPSTTEEISLSAPSAPQEYSQFSTGGDLVQLTEALTVSWFATQGEWSQSRTEPDGKNSLDPNEQMSGVIVGVLRDNRGGLDISVQTL